MNKYIKFAKALLKCKGFHIRIGSCDRWIRLNIELFNRHPVSHWILLGDISKEAEIGLYCKYVTLAIVTNHYE